MKNILKESFKFKDKIKLKKDLKPSIKSRNQILDTLKLKMKIAKINLGILTTFVLITSKKVIEKIRENVTR